MHNVFIIIYSKNTIDNWLPTKTKHIIRTRWLYCVECPQYSTRRRSASDTHRSGRLCYV